jgi:hypothetical protein
MLLRCERLEPPMSQMGQFRQIDTLATLSRHVALTRSRPKFGTAASRRDVPGTDFQRQSSRTVRRTLVGSQRI